MNKKLILMYLFIGLLTFATQAKYVQTCRVKYKQNDGWSKVYEMQVIFMSGTELNEESEGYSYSSYDSYAIMSWPEEKTTTIKLSLHKCGGIIGSTDCDYADFHNLLDIGYVTGTDKEEKEWKICYNNDCF
jgi:hypothetical protein